MNGMFVTQNLNIVHSGCNHADGTYGRPTTSVASCYRQNLVTGQVVMASPVSYANGIWTADFPAAAAPTQPHRIYVYGNDGSGACTGILQCP
jgi:hypothetical protein